MDEYIIYCKSCKRQYKVTDRLWRCTCGGVLNIRIAKKEFSIGDIDRTQCTLWRYKKYLSFVPSDSIVSLGEGMTPMIPGNFNGKKVYYKLEFVSPTGSYKDRGASVMLSMAAGLGIKHIVEDSSGNAGAAIAAYGAKAGIQCDIYVPASKTKWTPKIKQIEAYGARLVQVEGSRDAVAAAAMKAVDKIYYASHQWNPFFIQGIKTISFEMWEQLGQKAPDVLVVAIGGGGVLIGAYLGFKHLIETGNISKMPKIFGIQSKACAPVYHAFKEGSKKTKAVKQEATIAEGISIINPVRGEEILSAIENTKGAVEIVDDQSIKNAVEVAAYQGMYIEPTSGAVLAGLETLYRKKLISEDQCVAVVLTGSGLKTSYE